MDALQDNFQALPEWLKHAYHKDGAVNRVVKEWRMTSKPLASLYESLAMKMYELKNHWQSIAEHHASRTPVVIAIPPEADKFLLPYAESIHPE
jgi:hypothetical protein